MQNLQPRYIDLLAYICSYPVATSKEPRNYVQSQARILGADVKLFQQNVLIRLVGSMDEELQFCTQPDTTHR